VSLRVLFVLPSLEAGGAERVTVRLLTDLPRDRVEPQLALAARTGPLLSELPADVPLHDLGVRRVRYAPAPLLRLIRTVQPRVVFSNLGYLNLVLIASRPLFPRGVRLAVREANTVSAELSAARHEAVWRWAYRLLYPRADAIVCPSRAVLEDLAGVFRTPPGRLHHIPNPIDAEAIRRRSEQAASPFPSPGSHLVSVGRLAPQKAFGRLLEAFRIVGQAAPEAQLWILGEGPERGALEARARYLGVSDRVHLPGFVANPFAWMRHASMYVQSSEFEGLPNALLEAVACGTRVVAVDEPGGTREVLAEIPGSELVVSRSPEALARGIERVLADPGRPRPVLPQRFDPGRVVSAYIELFERLGAAG
jgi:glycosyltransferase involved in cell wall biosynthesis